MSGTRSGAPAPHEAVARGAVPRREAPGEDVPRGWMSGWLAVLLALGALQAIALLALARYPGAKVLYGDERYYLPRMRSIAQGAPTEFDPLWPSLYPQLMGLLGRIGPDHIVQLVQLVQLALWIAGALLFHRIVVVLTRSRPVALVATAFFLLLPDFVVYTSYLFSEVLYLFFFLVAVWLLVEHGERPRAAVAAGVAIGLSMLTKLILQPFLPVLLVAIAVLTAGSTRARLRQPLLVAAAAFVTVLPAMLHNRAQHGDFTIADSAAINAWVGLTDSTRAEFLDGEGARRQLDVYWASSPDFVTRNAIYEGKVRALVAQQGMLPTIRRQLSYQYPRLFSHETNYTMQLPDMADYYQFSATEHGWLARLLHVHAHVPYALLLGAAAVGLCLVRLWPPSWVQVLVLFLGYNLAVMVIVSARPRYLFPVLPVLMVLAGVAGYGAWRRLRGQAPPPIPGFVFSAPRVAIGLALAVVVELVAFRGLLFGWT